MGVRCTKSGCSVVAAAVASVPSGPVRGSQVMITWVFSSQPSMLDSLQTGDCAEKRFIIDCISALVFRALQTLTSGAGSQDAEAQVIMTSAVYIPLSKLR